MERNVMRRWFAWVEKVVYGLKIYLAEQPSLFSGSIYSFLLFLAYLQLDHEFDLCIVEKSCFTRTIQKPIIIYLTVMS